MAVKLKWRKLSGPSSRWQARMAGPFPAAPRWSGAQLAFEAAGQDLDGDCSGASASFVCPFVHHLSGWRVPPAIWAPPTPLPQPQGCPGPPAEQCREGFWGQGQASALCPPGRLSPWRPSPDGPMAEALAENVEEGFCGGQRTKMPTPA